MEFALAELGLTLRRLDNDLELLRDRNRELESELAAAQQEIESLRAKEHELSQTMTVALRYAAEIEERADSRAREIVARAEEAAMRIHSEASRRIEDSSAQFNELLRLKDNLLDAMRSVVADFDHAISRVGRGERLFPGVLQGVPGEAAPEPAAETPPAPAAPPRPAPAQPEAAPPRVEAAPPPAFASPVEHVRPAPPPPPAPPAAGPAPPPADTASIPAAPPPPAPPEPEEQIFETRVELDAGPFSDFAVLSAFERSLAHLPKVEDVYVRRLADDRALIELMLSEPAPLLQAMRESLPYTLEVRSANRSKLVVDVSVQTPAGAR